MKKFKIISIIIFVGFIQNISAQNKNLIYWNDSVKLSWTDFKAHPLKNDISAAMTNSSISFEISAKGDSAIITIYNIFNKQKSWVKKSGKTDYVLNHEQKHFDISEIYARKLRKTILEQTFTYSTIQKTGSKIVEVNYKEASEFQDLYDKETKHSTNVEQQTIWNTIIEEKLKEFSNFTSTEIRIFVKK